MRDSEMGEDGVLLNSCLCSPFYHSQRPQFNQHVDQIKLAINNLRYILVSPCRFIKIAFMANGM